MDRSSSLLYLSLRSHPQTSIREVFKEDAFGENVILDRGIYLGLLKVCWVMPAPVPSLHSGLASLMARGLFRLTTRIGSRTLQGPGGAPSAGSPPGSFSPPFCG